MLACHPLKVQTLPPLSEIVEGRTSATEFREVTPEELLSREPVKPDLELIRREIEGRRVMVTGAGGSIGSALCREILRHRTALVVLYDVSEFAIHSLERALRSAMTERSLGVVIVHVIGSVLIQVDPSRPRGPHPGSK